MLLSFLALFPGSTSPEHDAPLVLRPAAAAATAEAAPNPAHAVRRESHHHHELTRRPSESVYAYSDEDEVVNHR